MISEKKKSRENTDDDLKIKFEFNSNNIFPELTKEIYYPNAIKDKRKLITKKKKCDLKTDNSKPELQSKGSIKYISNSINIDFKNVNTNFNNKADENEHESQKLFN